MTAWAERHAAAIMDTYGPPRLVLVRGEGCWLWDDQGRRYLDLLAGIAVSSLGHGHPALVEAVCRQLASLDHVSNLFATPPQVELAERLLGLLGFEGDGRVFLCNSGTEALEAVFKLARRTGRPRIVAAAGGFHGRSMGALALTGKPSIREPFEPLPAGVEHVPYGDVAALGTAVDGTCAAVVLEPVQGEGGVRPAPPGYLEAARTLTSRHGALLVLDEVQTGIGRTGEWFAFQRHGILPDVVTVAKGLGGGFPVGACAARGPAAGLLGRGAHGSTFGGNPVASAAALAVLATVEREGLPTRADRIGHHLANGVTRLAHPLVTDVRGAGLLLGIALRLPVAGQVAAAALDAGFVVNDVAADVVRLAPPLVLTEEQADGFLAALPGILDDATSRSDGARS
ncbi:MAG TPA: acetylornithine transaminase [Jiangellales bacterium]|nr:acetylornithine transaminase [Jiangellales bacterium]